MHADIFCCYKASTLLDFVVRLPQSHVKRKGNNWKSEVKKSIMTKT